MNESEEAYLEEISEGNSTDICGFFEGYTTERFAVIMLCSSVSLFGVVANTVLLSFFRRNLPASIFTATLALLDVLICLTYFLLFGIDAGYVYLRSEFLFVLYHEYIVFIFFLSRVIQFAIPYMLIMATLERFVSTCSERTRKHFAGFFSDSGRTITVIVLLIFSISLRLPVLFATEVSSFPNCTDFFRSMSVSPVEYWKSSVVYFVFDVHFIVMMQTVLPFFILLPLNLIIVVRLLSESNKRSHMGKQIRMEQKMKKASISANNSTIPENYLLLEVTNEMMNETVVTKTNREREQQIRSAIYTTLAVAMSYLICNGLHLFCTFLERTNSSLLLNPSDPTLSSMFYVVLSDIVSISYMVTSAIRIFIYAKCNPKMRNEMVAYLAQCQLTRSCSGRALTPPAHS